MSNVSNFERGLIIWTLDRRTKTLFSSFPFPPKQAGKSLEKEPLSSSSNFPILRPTHGYCYVSSNRSPSTKRLLHRHSVRSPAVNSGAAALPRPLPCYRFFPAHFSFSPTLNSNATSMFAAGFDVRNPIFKKLSELPDKGGVPVGVFFGTHRQESFGQMGRRSPQWCLVPRKDIWKNRTSLGPKVSVL